MGLLRHHPAGSTAIDIVLDIRRDLPQQHAKWARDVPGSDPNCKDELDGCKGWAEAGEVGRVQGAAIDLAMTLTL